MSGISDATTWALSVLVVAGIAIALPRLFRWSDDWHHASLYEDFRKARPTATAEERQAELRLREAAARLRRRASAAISRTPQRYAYHIKTIAAAEATLLAAIDRDAAKTFIAWAENAPLDELLHRGAYEQVRRHMKRRPAASRPARRQLADAISSLTTER